MRDGSLFYLIGVAPANEFSRYDSVFRKVAESVQFARSKRDWADFAATVAARPGRRRYFTTEKQRTQEESFSVFSVPLW